MTPVLVLVALVVVVAAGLVVAEHVARTRVLERVRLGVEQAATAPADLRVPHRPLLLHAWRRHIPSAHTTIRGMAVGETGARIELLDVDLLEVDLTGPRLRPGIRARSGSFTARMSVEDLNLLVQLPPGVSRVELRPGRVRLRTLAGVGIDTNVEVADGRMRISPHGGVLRLLPPTGWTVRLPDLPFGAVVTSIEPEHDAVMLHGDLDPEALVLERS